MIGENAIHVLRLCLVLFIAWLIWYQFWIPYRVDYFRQRLFKLRDELFESAAAGNIEFTHPAYTDLRLTMNALIRYGHRVTILRIVMSMVSLARSGNSHVVNGYAAWREQTERIENEETRNRIYAFRNEISKIMAAHMILISPMTLAAICAIAIYLKMHEGIKKSFSEARDAARERIELLNVELATAKARGHHL